MLPACRPGKGGNSRFRCLAFTITELIVVLFLVAVLTAVAVPSFMSVISDSRIATSSNELLAAVRFTRAQAVYRGIPVTVCPSEDGESCAGNSHWEIGWIVFTDGSGVIGQLDGSDEALRIHGPMTGPVSVVSSSNFIRFVPSGELNTSMLRFQFNFTTDLVVSS